MRLAGIILLLYGMMTGVFAQDMAPDTVLMLNDVTIFLRKMNKFAKGQRVQGTGYTDKARIPGRFTRGTLPGFTSTYVRNYGQGTLPHYLSGALPQTIHPCSGTASVSPLPTSVMLTFHLSRETYLRRSMCSSEGPAPCSAAGLSAGGFTWKTSRSLIRPALPVNSCFRAAALQISWQMASWAILPVKYTATLHSH